MAKIQKQLFPIKARPTKSTSLSINAWQPRLSVMAKEISLTNRIKYVKQFKIQKQNYKTSRSSKSRSETKTKNNKPPIFSSHDGTNHKVRYPSRV